MTKISELGPTDQAALAAKVNTENAVSEGTAIPTSGTFTKGHKVWNTVVSEGLPTGWVCVASGTPGTWEPFGYAGTASDPSTLAQTDTTTTIGAQWIFTVPPEVNAINERSPAAGVSIDGCLLKDGEVRGDVPLTSLVATGTLDGTTFLRGDGTWTAPGGGGDVVKVGTPANNQVAVWTGNGTLEGETSITVNAGALNVVGDVIVQDEVYGGGWNGSLEVPTKNAVYDKIETLGGGGGGDVTKVGTPANNELAVWTGDGTLEGETSIVVAPGLITISGGNVIVGSDAYDAGWNGSLQVPTKADLYTKIETLGGGGGGDVTKVGTPVNNQLGVWTGDGTLEGESDLTFDGTTLSVTGGAQFTGDVAVSDEVYGAGWNGSLEVPTKNAVYDKIETIGGGGGGAATYAYKAADTSRDTTTTLADDPDLVLALEASSYYAFHCCLIHDGATAGDLKVAWTAPAGATVRSSNGASENTPSKAAGDTEVLSTASTDGMSQLIGVVFTGVTSGNLTLQWAQNTSDATATRVFEGSWLRIEKLN